MKRRLLRRLARTACGYESRTRNPQTASSHLIRRILCSLQAASRGSAGRIAEGPRSVLAPGWRDGETLPYPQSKRKRYGESKPTKPDGMPSGSKPGESVGQSPGGLSERATALARDLVQDLAHDGHVRARPRRTGGPEVATQTPVTGVR